MLIPTPIPSLDPSLTLLPPAQELGKWHQQKGGLPAPWAVWHLSLPCPPSGHSSQLVQALRKALEPALSDISVDWFVPDVVEALLTPREIPALYPGDQLLGYCSLFRVDGFRPRAPGVGLGCLKSLHVFKTLPLPVPLPAKLSYCNLGLPRDPTGHPKGTEVCPLHKVVHSIVP